jgi:hypothetical protein
MPTSCILAKTFLLQFVVFSIMTISRIIFYAEMNMNIKIDIDMDIAMGMGADMDVGTGVGVGVDVGMGVDMDVDMDMDTHGHNCYGANLFLLTLSNCQKCLCRVSYQHYFLFKEFLAGDGFCQKVLRNTNCHNG